MVDEQVLKVTEDVSWIGALDYDIVTFDVVMETKYGTTYNSYFINAEKKAVVETVKEKFWDSYFVKLKKVCNPEEIEYIILNHTEPDHSGCVDQLLKVAPNAKVVGSGNAIRYLNDLLGHPFPHLIVKDGQSLDLGDRTLHFIGSPNLHWPDSMMTYLPGDDLLFTCDIFGEHFCEPGVFDDQVGNFDDAFRYYYDVIMKPYSKFMLQAIEKIRPLKINMICPGHGAILRSYWRKYVELSEQYATEALMMPKPGTVVILYVSAYRNTGMIAEKIAEGIRLAGGTEVDVSDIENVDLATIEQKIIHSSSLIIGCPTFSQNILLPVYQVFALINPIRDRGKLAASFGSYGWSGEGTKLINSNLANLKLKLMDEGLLVKFTPHNEMLQKCIDYGRKFGESLLQSE